MKPIFPVFHLQGRIEYTRLFSTLQAAIGAFALEWRRSLGRL